MQHPSTPYRFGFVLTTAAGNMTRYLNLRKYAERDPEVECVWAPVKHFLEPDPFARLPRPLRTRAIVMHEAKPVLSQARRLDVIMFHAFEPYVASVLRPRGPNRPLLAWSQDNPPVSDGSKHPRYGGNLARSEGRRRLRYHFDRWCARRTDLFFPWSSWAADVFTQDCGVPAGRVFPLNVGLDLELWPFLPKPQTPARPQILFVGGDFVRKGGDLLLDVYRQHFAGRADLHLVTKQPPNDLLPGVSVYSDLGANDGRLRQLYEQADLFVLPTRADYSSIASMEAMATGRPVIATRTGGIPDIVRDGQTGFLIAPDDGAALADRMGRLLAERRPAGADGRRRARGSSSATSTPPCACPRILSAMKQRRGRPPVRRRGGPPGGGRPMNKALMFSLGRRRPVPLRLLSFRGAARAGPGCHDADVRSSGLRAGGAAPPALRPSRTCGWG